MNHYNFIIFGLILLILISGCVAKNNGVDQKDVIPISNITPSSSVSLLSNETITNSSIINISTKNDVVNKDIRLATMPIFNVTDNKTLLIITSTLNNTNKNIVESISSIDVLPEREMRIICSNGLNGSLLIIMGCTIPNYDTNEKFINSKIYLADSRTYYNNDVCGTFQNALEYTIGNIVYTYNVGVNGSERQLFSLYYAELRSPVKKCYGNWGQWNVGYELLMNRTLINKNQSIDAMNILIGKKDKECYKLIDTDAIRYANCMEEYNNMTKEYMTLIKTNLKREYVGLFYNKT